MLDSQLHTTSSDRYVGNMLTVMHGARAIPKKHESLFLLRRSLLEELRIIYWAERRLQRLLMRLMRSSFSADVSKGFKTHYVQSGEHLKRIGQIFGLLDEKALGKRCHVMVNIMNDAALAIKSTKKFSKERDIALLRIGQRIEQYEINRYSSLIRISTMMEEHEVTSLIELTLTEEREAEETFLSIKEDALKEELFNTSHNTDDLEAAEE
jgi:ferritin-like metal-binding protein YciE